MIITYIVGYIACYAAGIYLFVTDKDEILFRSSEAYRRYRKSYYAEAFVVSLITAITSWLGIILMGVAILKKRRK